MSHWSKSGWESSYFGGTKKVLYEYPEIRVPYKIDIKLPKEHSKKEELGWYCSSKLAKIFLLKVAEHEFSRRLLIKGKVEESVDFFGDHIKEYVVHPDDVKNCVGYLKVDTELARLFQENEDFLSKMRFSYELDPDGKCSKTPGSSESEGLDTEQGDDKGDQLGDEDGEGEEDREAPRAPGSGNLISEIEKEFLNVKLLRDSRPKCIEGSALGGELTKKVKFFPAVTHPRKNIYDSEEVLYSNQLVNMLDISFDPEKAVVKSLRSGKLDTSKICEVPSGNTSVYCRVEENQTTKPFSVCILGDESGSMSGTNIFYQEKLIKILYRAFSQILPKDKIFVYGHSGNSTPDIRVYNDKYNHDFEKKISSMSTKHVLCQNYDGPVIEAIHKKVREFTEDNIIFISVSDGEPGGYGYGGPAAVNEMKKIIEKCKRDGFVTLGIGFQYSGVREIYNYHLVIHKFDKDLAKKVSILINNVVKTEFRD
jgi:hypothetical protein